MSYNKGEKDFGEGPVGYTIAPNLRTNSCVIENPQNPHHSHFLQCQVSREGLHGAHRACKEQGSPCKGSSPSANEAS